MLRRGTPGWPLTGGKMTNTASVPPMPGILLDLHNKEWSRRELSFSETTRLQRDCRARGLAPLLKTSRQAWSGQLQVIQNFRSGPGGSRIFCKSNLYKVLQQCVTCRRQNLPGKPTFTLATPAESCDNSRRESRTRVATLDVSVFHRAVAQPG